MKPTPETLWPADYIRPGLAANHCADVVAGAYDVDYHPAAPPVILDIGANIGAFARFAAKRWPGAIIHCYEPHPDNFALLRRTVDTLAGIPSDSIILHDCAVLDGTSPAKLVQGGLNCGEHTLANDGDSREGVMVRVISTTELPRADILKVDAEGAENIIFAMLHKARRLPEFSAIMCEYHYDELGRAITTLLTGVGFREAGRRISARHRGVLKFLRHA